MQQRFFLGAFLLWSGFIVSAQQEIITDIHHKVTLIDQQVRKGEYKEVTFDDDHGAQTELKAFFKDGELLKIQATSKNLGGQTIRSYYFSNSELILVDAWVLKHPGLPNWEEAKSSELGEQELKRVADVVKEEMRFYLTDRKVLKAEPEEVMDAEEIGKKLNLEARDLLGRLE